MIPISSEISVLQIGTDRVIAACEYKSELHVYIYSVHDMTWTVGKEIKIKLMRRKEDKKE